MINEIYDLILAILPEHKDHPFEMTDIKDGASVYMFGSRKALIQERKDHVKLTIFATADNPIIFKVASIDMLRADPLFSQTVFAAYENAKANETLEEFGCCNSFVACSDALRCLYDDEPYYRGCMYRKNLEAGRIFYGKNKNV